MRKGAKEKERIRRSTNQDIDLGPQGASEKEKETG